MFLSYFFSVGVRGYMPIKILAELVTQKYLPSTGQLHPTDAAYKELFKKAQAHLTDQFDYFVGTSTGGLIAFSLAVNYNILDMKEIYSQSSYYFKRNYLGPLIYSKYNPSRIHRKIDQIINEIKFKDGTPLSAEHSTLLDIRNLLNPGNVIDDHRVESVVSYHGNFLEFVDEKDDVEDLDSIGEVDHLYRVKKEKVLLIPAYNTTTNSITIFNTSYSEHWSYRIADVLKATMAAPTYFPPYKMCKGKKINGHFVRDGRPELYIDGGVFANDPELAALWAIRMQWQKTTNYHLLSIGTGCYNTTLSSSTRGGYLGWIFNHGFLVNTLMDATRSFIETIASNLAKFNNMRRMKLNYQITKPMALDDTSFVKIFDEEWKSLKNEPDFKAFIYFYNNYITKQN
jgi:predicted acylesterase/phospholipase RssA